MKVVVTKSVDNRKPIAVIGAGSRVVFFEGDGGVYQLLGSRITRVDKERIPSLASLLTHEDRTPVYEGETLEVTF